MLMPNGKVVRFLRINWMDNLPNIISHPSNPSTLCQYSRPSSSPFRSLSPSDNPNKRQQIDIDWDFLTLLNYSFSLRRSLPSSSKEV